MPNTLYLPELREMLAEQNTADLREFCTALHPARTAEFMEGLTAEEAWAVLRYADMPLRAEIFGFFDEDKQVEIIETIDKAEMADLIGHMPPDDRVDLLDEVEPAVVEDLMPLVPDEERRDILRLQAYPEDTAGGEMTTEFARLSEEMTTEQAIEHIRRQAEELETVYYLYVLDDKDHLRGLISFRQLLMAKPGTKIADLMERDIVTVNVLDDREDVAAKVDRYNILAIPVVDDEHRLVGIITHDDVIDVVREEATEDAYRMAAVEPLDEGYMESPFWQLIWNRGIWLTILLVGAVLTAVVLQPHQETFKEIPWLVLFIPLVISSGGNTGSQSATLIITAITIGNISFGDWWRVVRRELLMGMVLGGALGMVGFLCAFILLRAMPAIPDIPDMTAMEALHAAATIPITLMLVVICGTLFGSTLPLLFHRLGLDPALMSNPFVAGIIDVVGILIYMQVLYSMQLV
ncbi:MAG: magnesium transporter [Pirellulales bacterium]|nr:magnesium transporter [Pirellulales bacterium]